MTNIGLNKTLNRKGLYFVHMNARSLANNIDLVRIFLSQNNIAVCTISETWLHSNIPDRFIEIPGYHSIRTDRMTIDPKTNKIKRGGGLLTYIVNKLDKCTLLSDLTQVDGNLEAQWIEIQIPNMKTIIVGNCYRPPNGNEEAAFQSLGEMIDTINKLTNIEIFILGDFNVDMSKPSKARKDIADLSNDNGLTQLIKDTTRQTTHSNTILDLIFTNSNNILESGVLYNNISDHFQVFALRKHQKKIKIPVTFKGRNYLNFDPDLLCDHIERLEWNEYDTLNDPNLLWELMMYQIKNIAEVLYPEKVFNINQQKDPWINDEIMHLIIEKDALLLQAKIENTDEAWRIARQTKNRAKNYINRAKSYYIQNALQNNQNDSKKFWRNINKILPNNKSNVTKINLKNQTTRDNIKDNDLPDFINNFFADIGPNLAQKFTDNYTFHGPIGRPQFEFQEFEPNTVLAELNKIDITKSSALDQISTRVIKTFLKHQYIRFTKLLNLCINTETFPDAWKIATVTPIKKEGFANNVSDLRPISILPLPAKILEKLLHKQLIEYMDSNKLLSDNQGGFRNGYSTNTIVAKFVDDVYTAINNRQISQSIFIDFSKAFDTIDHNILIKKLELNSLCPNAINLLKNYLTNRKQCVQVNGLISRYRNLQCGVPQGSVLGPLLFLIYINDMSQYFSNLKIYQYADDTVLSVSAETQVETNAIINDNLRTLEHWCNINRLTINTKKTKIMYFGATNKLKELTANFSNHLYDQNLMKVESYKYLGVILDSHLKFRAHIESLLKTLRYKLLILYKIQRYLTLSARLSVYKTTILPYIDYGDIFYQAGSKVQLRKIQEKQNKALKICFNLHGDQNDQQMHQTANLALLENRRNSHLLNFMYKRQTNKEYIDMRALPTRAYQATKFIVPDYNLSQFKNSILYKGSTMWNELPVETKNIDTYILFKEKTKALAKIP